MREGMFVKVIAASRYFGKTINPIITIHARYPRFIHVELMTHRAFSRNARSSRAVPIYKLIEEVKTNPVIPWHWGKNQPGMKAFEECNEYVIYQDFNEYGACERIAQLVGVKRYPASFHYVEASSQTNRGRNGFGSTGR